MLVAVRTTHGSEPLSGCQGFAAARLGPHSVRVGGISVLRELFGWHGSECLGPVPMFILLCIPLQNKKIWVFMMPGL